MSGLLKIEFCKFARRSSLILLNRSFAPESKVRSGAKSGWAIVKERSAQLWLLSIYALMVTYGNIEYKIMFPTYRYWEFLIFVFSYCVILV